MWLVCFLPFLVWLIVFVFVNFVDLSFAKAVCPICRATSASVVHAADPALVAQSWRWMWDATSGK